MEGRAPLWGVAGGRSRDLLGGSQGPFFLWEGQRGRWHRRWGFMLVNIDSTGFLQSPTTLAPLLFPLFLSPIFQGVCGQGSQPELGHFPGQPPGLERGCGSPRLPSSSSFSGPSSLFHCQLLPLQLLLKPPEGFSPLTPAGGGREAGPGLATPAGTDALTLCV